MKHFTDVITLTEELLRLPSITPNDAGCQKLIASYLQPLGFEITPLRFGQVDNLWAKCGTEAPLFVFAGHTDVVPTGTPEDWTSPPFTPTQREGFLYGRGAADMKGSLAAMICATQQFLEQQPHHQGSIAFLITSDEEGSAVDGTAKVMQYLREQQETLTWCIVGEPSSEQTIADTIKVGRRGSLNAVLRIHGKQGHIAYPHLADNPIHRAFSVLNDLATASWEPEIKDNSAFPPTALQFSNIQAGYGVTNVIPGQLQAMFNFRYSPAVTAAQLQARVKQILDEANIHYEIDWRLTGEPFLTPPGQLRTAVNDAVKKMTGQPPQISTGGGTSDGRFIAPSGCEVVELGPCNQTIHQVNECVSIKELQQLTQIYLEVLQTLLPRGGAF